METAVVIPCGANRLSNLLAVLKSLQQQTVQPRLVVLVFDGPDAAIKTRLPTTLPLATLETPKHEPGMEQPRNIGVRLIEDLGRQDKRFAGIEFVWFLDTDVVVRPRCLEMYAKAMKANPERRVLIGPYEWNPPGAREPVEDLRNDPRWPSFDRHDAAEALRGDLSAGLACFSGNLIWPIEQFKAVGGFWADLHHGRCEDGELGLRAVAMDVPISFVREARGWHLHHSRNHNWIVRTNAIDVPKLNARHPWVQERGLVMTEEDGRRFDCRCKMCGNSFPSAGIWAHQAECQGEQVT